MERLVRRTLVNILAILSVSCSSEVTDPKKMIEIAAKDENPHARLTELYLDSVLPALDVHEAWSMAGKFAQNALEGTDTGYQYDTVDFPWKTDMEAVKSLMPAVETESGKYYRQYRVMADFHADNVYGARTRLSISIFMRTADNETWKAFQAYVRDPSKPILTGRVFVYEEDAWKGFETLDAPDSLYTQLDAYIKEHSKETGVLTKIVGGWETKGPYVEGKKHGHFVERNSYGIVFEGEYVNDKRQGRWVRRRSDGTVIEDGDYLDGEKHGRWNDPQGIGNYVHGKKQGRWTYRASDGVIEEADYVDDKPHGMWTWRKPDGETGGGEYVHGKKVGSWVELTVLRATKEGLYVGGKKQGRWVERAESGFVEEGDYANGKKHGWWTERLSNGRVMRTEYVHGKKRRR